MHALAIAALLAVTLLPAEAPICRAGPSLQDWTGSPADLAGIQAAYEAQYARSAGQVFTHGAPVVSPWSATVACTI